MEKNRARVVVKRQQHPMTTEDPTGQILENLRQTVAQPVQEYETEEGRNFTRKLAELRKTLANLRTDIAESTIRNQ